MSDLAWADWRAGRPPTPVLHLDTAAVGRSSIATLETVAVHTRLEAEVGGYVAQEQAAPQLDRLRADVGTLLGTEAEGIAFVESAMVALDTLLRSWSLAEGARVAVAPASWGPNVELLKWHGLEVEVLPVDACGVIDTSALAALMKANPPDLVLVDLVAAQRGLVQPAGEVVELGKGTGVPVWLDAAQAVGQVAVPPDADAVVATSRKWLTGPRGVGMLAVAERHRSSLRVRRPAKLPDRTEVRLLESEEAHVAGRVGLGAAVREHLNLGVDVVEQRLREVGEQVRSMVESVPGWEVVHPGAPAGATTALRPTAGQDVVAVHERLLREHQVLTSVCLPWRAPLEMTGVGPWLRLSPQVDVTTDELDRVAASLPRR